MKTISLEELKENRITKILAIQALRAGLQDTVEDLLRPGENNTFSAAQVSEVFERWINSLNGALETIEMCEAEIGILMSIVSEIQHVGKQDTIVH